MSELQSKGINDEWINIVAFVTDNATALTMASERLVKITPETPVYNIEDLLEKAAFIAGLNYSTTVSFCLTERFIPVDEN